MNSQLPRSSWIQVALGDLGTLHCGQSPATSDVNREGNGELYVTGPEQWHDSKVRKTKWTTTPKRIAPDGSIFIAVKGAGVGKMAFGIRCAIGRDVYAFEASKHLDQRFIFWAIKEGVNDIVMKAQGDIPGISKGHILDHVIRLPSLPTQRKTVEKIEAVFERIDKGVENLRAAKTTLALYRQSLLKSAFEGRLTADWRAQNAEKLEDPKTLLARIQKERDARYKAALDDWQTALAEWRDGGEKGKKPAKPKRPEDFKATPHDRLAIPSAWVTVPLGGVAFEAVLGKMLDRQKNRGIPRPYIGNINLRWGAFDVYIEKTMPIEDHEVTRYGIRAGDLVVCEGGEPGRCAVWQDEDDIVFIQKALHRVRFTPAFNAWFAYYFFRFATLAGLLDRHYTGSTIKHLTGTALAEVLLPICAPAEQAEITRILDARLDAADKMEAEIDATLTRADALRQSILKQAFSGKLVRQDPNDEPATTLLARIKAEREVAPKTKRKKRATA